MDLFGYQAPAELTQHELAGPVLHIGRKCKTCGSPIVETVSGFDSCSRGCGKLSIPQGYDQGQMKNVTIPVWRKL